MIPRLDTLNEADIPALLRLAQEIGWGYNRENWLQFMTLGSVVGHRDETGKPISSAVMIEYGEQLCWLTSFIVSPRFQRRGLAQQMWLELKKRADATAAPVGLVSTTEGLPFYRSMGFRQTGILKKLVRPNGFGVLDRISVPKEIRSITPDDFEAIAQLDREATGVERGSMIKGKLENATSSAKFVGSNGEIQGFAIAVMEGDLLCVGPVIAPNQEEASKLILFSANGHPGRVRLDLFPECQAAIETLTSLGFVQEREPPVLCYGAKDLPEHSPGYIAIAAQALG